MLSSIIIKRRSREFHVVVVRWRQKMNKKVCCTCKVVALFIKPFAFLTFSLPSPLSFPKLPNMVLRRRCHPIWTTVRLQEVWFCFYSQCTLAIISNSMWLYFQTLNDPSCFFLYRRYRRRGRHIWFHFGGSLERVEIATPHLRLPLPPSAPCPLSRSFFRPSSSRFWNSTWWFREQKHSHGQRKRL